MNFNQIIQIGNKGNYNLNLYDLNPFYFIMSLFLSLILFLDNTYSFTFHSYYIFLDLILNYTFIYIYIFLFRLYYYYINQLCTNNIILPNSQFQLILTFIFK